MKMHPVGAELFREDRHDVTNLTAEFSNFAKAPKKLEH